MKRFISLLLFAVSLSASAAEPLHPPYVGAIAINPCQDAKVLADWYAKLGIETEAGEDGGFYGMFETPAGPFVFGIHAKDKDAPKTSSGSVEVVFRVADFDRSVSEAAKRGLTPIKPVEEYPGLGRFAEFKDPDGNKVSLWGN